jgi:hypothetical protein
VSGDTLAGDKAVPYIVNFQMVDTEDGKISAAEFETGCARVGSRTPTLQPPRK